MSNHIQRLLRATDSGNDGGAVLGNEQASWEVLLDQWESESPASIPTTSTSLPPSIPLPTLLTYHSPNPLPLSRVDHLPPTSRPPSPPAPQISLAPSLHPLLARLLAHLPDKSMLFSLQDILARPSKAQALEGDLVGVMGWEGEALALVTEMLVDETREALVSYLSSTTLDLDNLVASLSAPTASSGSGKGKSTIPITSLPAATQPNWDHQDKYKKFDHFQRYERGGQYDQFDFTVRSDVREAAGIGYTQEEADERIRLQLEENADRGLFSSNVPIQEKEVYPHVYTSSSASAKHSYGGRLALPAGTRTVDSDIAKEVIIPPSRPIPPKTTERLINISELDSLASGCFPGKTDVAIMSILRTLSLHLHPHANLPHGPHSIDRNAFKIIYVAPMKALAAEITRKIGKRLAWLGIKVRELTGDMQLTRQEIQETQMIVTTPEKWDVVTRKPTGEGELASKVKLLIIDEIHLLNEERGAVIETIVARTLRQVESMQNVIRIVGLSATLPNYVDVADFLSVNRHVGLFFFDSSFRPVPLEQRFIGVRGKVRSEQSKKNMDQVVYDKVTEMLKEGHQVMVFVHARKETVNTALKFKEMLLENGEEGLLSPEDHPSFEFFKREIATSRNKEMKELFQRGFGIHNAGMLRSDRNMMEKMFEANCIRVLVCTATLAWGVNLPAHAVVIKGTQVYDAGKGSFVDLSILDVLQIFGRAGRPGYETSGVGFICTTQDKLDNYLDAVLSQHPIESQFVPGMVDSLNAEIALGTIKTVNEAARWLSYTYLFVRMKRNPTLYGMEHDTPIDDPSLAVKRNGLVETTAKLLTEYNMIKSDPLGLGKDGGALISLDLGRIAAKYYLKHETIGIFNKEFREKMSEADCLALLSLSSEFHRIQVRENEVEELKRLELNVIPCEAKGSTDNTQGKVNILLQAYICNAPINDFALVSEMAYVAQNGARIIRALLEMALSRKWAMAARVLASMSKTVEKKMWSYENPLKQFKLHYDVAHHLQQWADEIEPSDLAKMSGKDVGDLIRMNPLHGQAVVNAAKRFPHLVAKVALRPLSHDLLRVDVSLTPEFVWDQNSYEPMYVWIEDEGGLKILQWFHISLRPSMNIINLQFTISINETQEKGTLRLRIISDKWVGSDEEVPISLGELVMPTIPTPNTPILNIPYLHISALQDADLMTTYSRVFSTFNAIQSQAFFSFYHTASNVLLSAPSSSGKTVMGDIAVWRAYRESRSTKALVISPLVEPARETVARLKSFRGTKSHIQVNLLRGSSDLDHFRKSTSSIGVATPSILLPDLEGIASLLTGVSLIVLDDLHLLDASMELVLMVLLFVAQQREIRVVGLSSSLHSTTDLASWLSVPPQSTYSFSPSERAMPVTTTLRPFSISHSATLIRTMVSPTYGFIKDAVDNGGQAIIFVPSRMQCQTVADDLVKQSGIPDGSGETVHETGFLKTARADVEPLTYRLRNTKLSEPLLHGIGIYHSEMSSQDSSLILELYAAGIIRVLICPRELCWSLPMQARTVVVMGAQYLELGPPTPSSGKLPERTLRNYSLQELTKMQGFAAQSPSTTKATQEATIGGHFILMCQAEQLEAYQHFLHNGLPSESSLLSVLEWEASPAVISALKGLLGSEPQRQDAMELLSWSYMWKRMQTNPTYYDSRDGQQMEGLSRAVDTFFAGIFHKEKEKEQVKEAKEAQARKAAAAIEKMQADTAKALEVAKDAKDAANALKASAALAVPYEEATDRAPIAGANGDSTSVNSPAIQAPEIVSPKPVRGNASTAPHDLISFSPNLIDFSPTLPPATPQPANIQNGKHDQPKATNGANFPAKPVTAGQTPSSLGPRHSREPSGSNEQKGKGRQQPPLPPQNQGKANAPPSANGSAPATTPRSDPSPASRATKGPNPPSAVSPSKSKPATPAPPAKLTYGQRYGHVPVNGEFLDPPSPPPVKKQEPHEPYQEGGYTIEEGRPTSW